MDVLEIISKTFLNLLSHIKSRQSVCVLCEIFMLILEADLNNQLFISICAGVTLDQLRGHFGPEVPLARVMPNIPVKVIQGTFPYSLPFGSSEEAESQLLSVFSSLGMAVKVPEQQFNAAQGISGCGPAFVALFVESLVDAGVNQGLSRDLAFKLASSTVHGTGQLFKQTGVSPADLKYKICSPSGVTIAGVMSLEESNFRNAVIKAHSRTVERTAEIENLQK